MLLFLVRHAQSKTTKGFWQTPDSKLSKIGEKQAEILSRRSRFSKLDKIFSSNWERSKKTAEIASKNLGVEFEILDYIYEREQTLEMYGASRESSISKKYLKKYYENYKNLDWKFKKEEESIRGVLERTAKLSEFLIKNYVNKQVMVISHDVFIRCFISMVLLGKNYADDTMANIIASLNISNTGITLLTYRNKEKFWKAYYVNDFSHLQYVPKRKS